MADKVVENKWTGYVKLFRSIIDWQWFQDDTIFKFFLYLVMTVNIESKMWKGIEVKRGQRVTSQKALAEELGMSRKTVLRCLKILSETGEISYVATNKYTIITVNNFGNYQDFDVKNRNTKVNIKGNTEVNIKVNTKGNTTKEDKNYKNDKKEYHEGVAPADAVVDTSQIFSSNSDSKNWIEDWEIPDDFWDCPEGLDYDEWKASLKK